MPKLSKITKYPNYCCQECGEIIGWLGRFFEWLLGKHHVCHKRQEGTFNNGD